MEADQDFKSLILKEENGGRSRARTADPLLVSSTVMPYIADSYSGYASFLRPLRVSAALIAQHSEQLFALPDFFERLNSVPPLSGQYRSDRPGIRRPGSLPVR
jgi:hypothetical protein